MNTTLTRILVGGLLLVTTAHAAEPVSVSGIYPHLTVFNSDPKREKPEMECGLGAAAPWAGKHIIYAFNDGLNRPTPA